MTADLPAAERAMIQRARTAFTRLVGLELGDTLADELLDARLAAMRETRFAQQHYGVGRGGLE